MNGKSDGYDKSLVSDEIVSGYWRSYESILGPTPSGMIDAHLDDLARGDGFFVFGSPELWAGEPLHRWMGDLYESRFWSETSLRPWIANFGGRSGLSALAASPAGSRVVSDRVTRTGRHIVVQQQLRGHDVVGARFSFHMDLEQPYAVTGRPLSDLESRDLGKSVPTTAENAKKACREMFGVDAEIGLDAVLVAFPVESGATWAYLCAFESAPASVIVFLQAEDLTLLMSFDIASAVNAQALAHRVNPVRTPPLNDVEIDIADPTPTYQLVCPTTDVRPRVPPRLNRATTDFQLQEPDGGFDEVQAYYHLCRARQYFEGLIAPSVFSARPLSPVVAFVRDIQSPNNAYYQPLSGRLLFGDAGGRPTARSGDVVYHEFGHAISDAICGLGRGKRDCQARGLSEGYSDYFACSALNDPMMGDYVDGFIPGFRTRDCSNSALRFRPGRRGPEHETGAVWASTLWELRSKFGILVDTLAAESLYHLSRQSTFSEGKAALIACDRRLYPDGSGKGLHEDDIDAAFQARL